MSEVKAKPKRGCLGRFFSFAWKAIGLIILIVVIRNMSNSPGETSRTTIVAENTPVAFLVTADANSLVPLETSTVSTTIVTATLIPTVTDISSATLVSAQVTTKVQSAPPSLAIPQTEYDALVAFYESTNGVNWINNDGWLNSDSPCRWFGIQCTENHITSIKLNENGLSGPIPPIVGNLTNLVFLELNYNNLNGEIPSSLGNLSQLEWLGLSNNPILSGKIPFEFGNLVSLKSLSLRNNQTSGELPISLINLDLDRLWIEGSNLCAPANPDFQEWLTGIDDLLITNCNQPLAATTMRTSIGPTAQQSANLRSGSSTEHPVVGAVAAGETLDIVGQTADGTWYKLSNETWIAAFLVDGVTDNYAVVQSAPIPSVIQNEPSATLPTEPGIEVVATQTEPVALTGGALVITALDKSAEYADIANRSGQVIDLTDWTLRSETGMQDCPLSGILEAGQTLRIWAKTGEGFSCGFAGNIWNNSEHDPAVLLNTSGAEVSRYEN